ncbi:MAG: phage integrase SAM-like domain-containing protein [Sphingobacteriaceae bacterium]|nr:phage integrase SAM-like domain-containing protein [Sphingobacteriaceae bacterium]
MHQVSSLLRYSSKNKGKQSLSQNSKYSYYNKLKACLKLAYKEK